MDSPRRLVVVTGSSGSGKSIALHALEDMGYYCVDNLPGALLARVTADWLCHPEPNQQLVALGMDMRNSSTDAERLRQLVAEARSIGIVGSILFLDARDDVLMRRFSETRRRHPLTNQQCTLEQAIALERAALAGLQELADVSLETSDLSPHQLRNEVQLRFPGEARSHLQVSLQSFGFKFGPPRNLDFQFDVRCLPNPHWQPELRPLTGLDTPVIRFLSQDDRVASLVKELGAFLQRWVICTQQEGRSYVSVGIGCTGGRHRSVHVAERLSAELREAGHNVICRHRELS